MQFTPQPSTRVIGRTAHPAWLFPCWLFEALAFSVGSGCSGGAAHGDIVSIRSLNAEPGVDNLHGRSDAVLSTHPFSQSAGALRVARIG
jgi:hypothetical protein